MRSLPQLRIIHISDLHFGADNICGRAQAGAAVGMPTLASLLVKALSKKDEPDFHNAPGIATDTPLVVAATGDLTQQAAEDEFDEAYEFFNELLATPVWGRELSTKDLFVVPGNHDVKFTKDKPEARFANYCTFYNKLFENLQYNGREFIQPHQADRLNQIHEFPDSRFLIAEINSCLYVKRDTEEESRGNVDFSVMEKLEQKLESLTEHRKWIKVALVHHHPVLLPSFVEIKRGYDSILNSNALLRLLREHGFQLVLHGHKHYPQVFSYDPDTAWRLDEPLMPLFIVAGGSSGSSELPEATTKCNTFNVITVTWDPDATRARIRVTAKGLIRTGDQGTLNPYQWHWKTLRVFDKVLPVLPSSTDFPVPRKRISKHFPKKRDRAEDERLQVYEQLRGNMPVLHLIPSLEPGQAYQARAWLVQHESAMAPEPELPVRVMWSAGRLFHRQICGADAAPEFCAEFHYYGPVLVQAELEFKDGSTAYGYVYARLPGPIPEGGKQEFVASDTIAGPKK